MKIDKIIKATDNRYLPMALVDFNDLAKKLNIPTVIKKEAIVIYKKAHKKKIIGRTTKVIIAACIYAAIRNSPDTSRTLLDIERASNFKKNLFRHAIGECTKIWDWRLDFQIQNKNLEKFVIF